MRSGNIEVVLVALTFMFPDSLDFNCNLKCYIFILTVHVAFTIYQHTRKVKTMVFLFKICCDGHDKHMDSKCLTSRMLICFTSSERSD